MNEIIDIWRNFSSLPQELKLPTAPVPAMIYRDEPDRPQPQKDRDAGNGQAITVRQIAKNVMYLVLPLHRVCTTIPCRGAAGGAILNRELLKAKGYISKGSIEAQPKLLLERGARPLFFIRTKIISVLNEEVTTMPMSKSLRRTSFSPGCRKSSDFSVRRSIFSNEQESLIPEKILKQSLKDVKVFRSFFATKALPDSGNLQIMKKNGFRPGLVLHLPN